MELYPDAACALERIRASAGPEAMTAAEARQAHSSARVAVAPLPEEVAVVQLMRGVGAGIGMRSIAT